MKSTLPLQAASAVELLFRAIQKIATEVQMLRNGALLISRIFESGEEALAWAEEERQRMLGHEWSVA